MLALNSPPPSHFTHLEPSLWEECWDGNLASKCNLGIGESPIKMGECWDGNLASKCNLGIGESPIKILSGTEKWGIVYL